MSMCARVHVCVCVCNFYLRMAPNSWKRIEKSRLYELHSVYESLDRLFAAALIFMKKFYLHRVANVRLHIASNMIKNEYFFSWLNVSTAASFGSLVAFFICIWFHAHLRVFSDVLCLFVACHFSFRFFPIHLFLWCSVLLKSGRHFVSSNHAIIAS